MSLGYVKTIYRLGVGAHDIYPRIVSLLSCVHVLFYRDYGGLMFATTLSFQIFTFHMIIYHKNVLQNIPATTREVHLQISNSTPTPTVRAY